MLGELLEGAVEVSGGDRDVAVARADVVGLHAWVVRELEASAVVGEAHEDVGRPVRKVHAAELFEAELFVEVDGLVDVGDAVAGVDQFRGHISDDIPACERS